MARDRAQPGGGVGPVADGEGVAFVTSVDARDELLLQPRRHLPDAIAEDKRVERVGGQEDEVAARLEHARDLGKDVLGGFEMLEHPHAHHHVEGCVREWQMVAAALQHRHALPTLGQGLEVGVEPDRQPGRPPEALDAAGAPAAEIQDRRVGRQAALDDDVELVAAGEPARTSGAVLLPVGGLCVERQPGVLGHLLGGIMRCRDADGAPQPINRPTVGLL